MKYKYDNVKLERVIDGDSMWVNIELGFMISTRQVCRLARIDAPPAHLRYEMSTLPIILRPGLVVTEVVSKVFEKYSITSIESIAFDKYSNRFIGEVELETIGNLSCWLLENSYAKEYNGRGPKPTWRAFEILKIMQSADAETYQPIPPLRKPL
jgi:hypothetical protein